MKSTTNKHLVEESLDQLCEHPYFDRSPRSKRLLKFLVNQALDGNDVKEQTIGIELFNETFDPENNDGKVRVYMFNLRKKLKEYYAKYGKKDNVIFILEKGEYNISFRTQKELKAESENSYSRIFSLRFISIALILCSFALGGILLTRDKNYYCWTDFFASDAKNLCVIADHFMVEIPNEKREWDGIYIQGINSDADLVEYLSENPTETMRSSKYSLLSKMAPYAIFDLSKWFFAYKSTFNIIIETEFRHDDTRNNNIIYVGQFKTMNVSEGIFLQDSKVFSVFDDGFRFDDGEQSEVYVTSLDNHNRTEYSMVSYQRLKNGKKALFFTSNHDIGTMATVHNFTNKQWLKEFYKDLPEGTEHFNALFEVTGIERTEISCKLERLEVLE